MSNKKYFRNCPNCNKKLSYPSEKRCELYVKKGSLCSECSAKKSDKAQRKKRSEKARRLGKIYEFVCKNCNNEFTSRNPTHNKWCKKCRELFKYGWKEDYVYEYGENGIVVRVIHTGKIRKPYTREERDKRQKKKSNYTTWLERYGKGIADQKLIECKKKHSDNNRGSGNPMYGKPAPKGSGGGWSGWYKGWYFRSLKELSYMINVIEKNNYKWRTAETTDLAISYVDENGENRTYFADFLVEEKWMVEVKPKRLMGLFKNKLKKEVALKFCEENNYEYKLEEPELLSEKEIYQLYIKKEIIFNKGTDKKAMAFFVKKKLC